MVEELDDSLEVALTSGLSESKDPGAKPHRCSPHVGGSKNSTFGELDRAAGTPEA